MPDRRLVSVLLPVHNGGRLLEPALESVLRQSYSDLEVLLLDDGSSDGAVDALARKGLDPRVRVLQHENRGLAATLNRGLDEASGAIVVRMDADDIATSRRIELQVEALQEPGRVLVGGQLQRLVEDRPGRPTRFPLQHDEIVRGLVRRAHVMSHPAVAFRADAAKAVGGYWRHGPAEDWDFFLRMATVGRLANVDHVVLQYRYHASGINASSMSTVRRNMVLATLNHRRRGRGQAELEPADLSRARWVPWRMAAAAESRSLTHYRRSLRADFDGRAGSARRELALAAAWWPAQAARRMRGR